MARRSLVFTAMAIDPVAVGLAKSYTRPGGATTGNVMNAIGEDSLTSKRLGLFKDLMPRVRRLGMIEVAITDWRASISATAAALLRFAKATTNPDVAAACSTKPPN